MCPLTEYQPHREQLPVRYCFNCGTLLSSANTTAACFPCGGWLEIATSSEQQESFEDLMVEVWA